MTVQHMDERLRALEKHRNESGGEARYAVALLRVGRVDEALWCGAAAGPPVCRMFWEDVWTKPMGVLGRARMEPPEKALVGEMRLSHEPQTQVERASSLEWIFSIAHDHGRWGWVNAVEFRCQETGRVLKVRRLAPMEVVGSGFRMTWQVKKSAPA